MFLKPVWSVPLRFARSYGLGTARSAGPLAESVASGKFS
jgi:hypothetical protein